MCGEDRICPSWIGAQVGDKHNRNDSENPTMLRKPYPTAQLHLPIPDVQKLLAAAGRSQDARDTLRAMLLVRKNQASAWRGQSAVPPGSFADAVTDAFRQATDVPLELPLSAVATLISGRLLEAGCLIDLHGQMVKPCLWTVVLAPSGAGKTFATRRVLDIAGQKNLFPDPASAAKFVQDLAEHNNSTWIRDEFGQFLRSLGQQTHMAELRDYLLRLYDGQQISRRTKTDTISVESPALTILGSTVLETFKDCVGPESLVDGFAQRFNFIIAPADPLRRAVDFPLYDLRGHQDAMRSAWASVEQVPLHPIYKVGEEAIGTFKAAFRAMMPEGDALPVSFFRRLMFSAVRYAAVYHLLLGDSGDELTARDMAWALRMVALHLEDARQLLDDYGLSELERVVRRVEEVKAEIEAEGRRCKPRDLCRRIAAIRTASEARSLLQLVEESDGTNARM